MKKALTFIFIIIAFTLQFCTSSKRMTASKRMPLTYAANIQPLMAANCTPCHFPPKGFKKPYNTYQSVKTDIGEIIARIGKNPDEKGFMPFKHPKLSDSVIHVFVAWNSDGLLEK